MEAALPLILTCLIGVTTAVTAGILLRLPLKMTDMGSRLSGVEREVAELDGKLKKALRRIGIEERKARTTKDPSPTPSTQPELPFDDPDEDEPDPLDAAARFARLNGKLVARTRGRR